MSGPAATGVVGLIGFGMDLWLTCNALRNEAESGGRMGQSGDESLERAIDVNADGFSGERRRHQRFTHPPLCLAFEGRSHTTTDWSLGGFVVDDYEGALTPGSLFSITAIGAVGASMTPVDIRSRVVRTNHEQRILTVSFLVIDTPGYAVLRALVGDRMKLFGAPS